MLKNEAHQCEMETIWKFRKLFTSSKFESLQWSNWNSHNSFVYWKKKKIGFQTLKKILEITGKLSEIILWKFSMTTTCGYKFETS